MTDRIDEIRARLAKRTHGWTGAWFDVYTPAVECDGSHPPPDKPGYEDREQAPFPTGCHCGFSVLYDDIEFLLGELGTQEG